MNPITYNQFKKEVRLLGLDVLIGNKFVSVRHESVTLATIEVNNVKILDLNWGIFPSIISEDDRIKLADLCWQLASTPIEQRVGDELYHLRVTDKYLTFFNSPYEYLNVVRHTGTTFISDKEETTLCKTVFTGDEINELSKEYDLSLFKKEEVLNDL